MRDPRLPKSLYCSDKRGDKQCDKQKGHVGRGDKRHRDGAWEWGGYRK